MKAAEDLKEKLAAERQSKLLLEVKIRKEMAEAMFRQLLETEEAWRQVILQSAVRLEEFHMYNASIWMYIHLCLYSGHIYSCYLEKIGLDSFKTSDGKGRKNIKLAEISLFPFRKKK